MTSEERERFEALLEYAGRDGRICPQPNRWSELWELLPKKKRKGAGRNPPAPLILAAWWDTPPLPKILRLREHIEYAAENGALDEVETFLMGLSDADWATLDDM